MPEASPRPSPTLDVPRLDTSISFRKEAYAAQKRAVTAMDICDHPQEIRLDREAMTLLDQEGFVRAPDRAAASSSCARRSARSSR